MKRSTRGLGVVVPLAMVAAVGLAGCQPTLGLRVTTTADGHDATPGDGVCEMTAGAGDCSLRAAVEEANGSTDSVHVSVPAGTYATGALGALAISGSSPSMAVEGSGGPVTIDGTGTAWVFDVHAHASIVGLTVKGGSFDGVHVAGGGQLAFAGSVSTMNTRSGIQGDAGSVVNVTLSTLSNNGSAGITGAGSVTLARSVVTGNAGSSGAAVDVSGGATISDTTISHNSGAGISSEAGATTVLRSTIDHNQSSWACANAGCVSFGQGPGGIFVNTGTFSLIDSTVSDNTAISPFDGTITEAGMQIGFATCGAGCVFNFATATITASTVDRLTYLVFGQATVSTSAMGRCAAAFSGTPEAAKFVDGGGNVVVGTSCTFPTQLQVPDLQLGPLADNGGATQTRLPLGGSPVLDHVPTGTAGLCDAANPTDQRGIIRPQGPACDAGAVEGHS